jgi:hypothetical protein
VDQVGMDRPGNAEIQLDLLYDYRTNVPLYPEFQAFFRKYQPPTAVLTGRDGKLLIDAGFAVSRQGISIRSIPNR